MYISTVATPSPPLLLSLFCLCSVLLRELLYVDIIVNKYFVSYIEVFLAQELHVQLFL